MNSDHLGRAREIAQEWIERMGLVTMHEFMAGMPCSVEDTYTAVGVLVAFGELIELPQSSKVSAERKFVRALGTQVPPDP